LAVDASATCRRCDGDRLSVRSGSLQSRFPASSPGIWRRCWSGPARIADAAAHGRLDLTRIRLIDTPDDPAEAARRAIALARDGHARADQGAAFIPTT
jgi:hypothetical protein